SADNKTFAVTKGAAASGDHRRPQPPTPEPLGGLGGRQPRSQPSPLPSRSCLERSGLVRVKSVLSADLPPSPSQTGSITWAARPRPALFLLALCRLGELACLIRVKSVPSNMAGCICVQRAANRRWVGSPFCFAILYGGQHGQHNPSDPHHRHTVADGNRSR